LPPGAAGTSVPRISWFGDTPRHSAATSLPPERRARIWTFRGMEGWRGEGSFRGWLFRIAGNLLKDRFRAGKGRIFLAIEDHDLANHTDPEAELVADEVGQQLVEGLTRLPRMQREVFLLRVQQGLDYTEIAAALGSSPGAARVHYHHAVKRLKEWLS